MTKDPQQNVPKTPHTHWHVQHLRKKKALYWIILRKQKTDGDEYFFIDALHIYKNVHKSNNTHSVITMGHMHIITAKSQKGKMSYITH